MGDSLEQWRAVCGRFNSRLQPAKRSKLQPAKRSGTQSSSSSGLTWWFHWLSDIRVLLDQKVQCLLPLRLIQLLLFAAGIEINPGPDPLNGKNFKDPGTPEANASTMKEAKDCKGHQDRVRVSAELKRRIEQPYVPREVANEKVFTVSRGPKEELWSLKDFEKEFEKSREWEKMREDVWMVPTMALKDLLPNTDHPEGRLTPSETTKDMEDYLDQEFRKQCEVALRKMPEKERRKREKNLSKFEEHIKSVAAKATEKNPKAPLYVQRLGDDAELEVMNSLRIAVDGIPSLILRGVKTFHDFPKTLSEAGINISVAAEQDIVVLVPKGNVLCVRFIEVKCQTLMPWDNKRISLEGREVLIVNYPLQRKRFHDDLIPKMYKQLQKNITAFFELFPDFHPDDVDLQVLGAVPFTHASDLFCSDCAEMTITAGNSKHMRFF